MLSQGSLRGRHEDQSQRESKMRQGMVGGWRAMPVQHEDRSRSQRVGKRFEDTTLLVLRYKRP